MDALELLRSWPGWANAGMETILSSPAWRMEVCAGEVAATFVCSDEAFDSPIELAVTFDGVPAVLSLADSTLYPDLHLLWAKRADLPPEIVLALVEKECGVLFMLLEKATQRQFGIVGFADRMSVRAQTFAVQGLPAPLLFSLELPTELMPVFGSLECLDAAHPVIREATREIWADYGVLPLTDDELEALAPGAYLLRTGEGVARWVTELPLEDAVHAMGICPETVTFEAFAAEALPPLPEPSELKLVKGGRELATVRPAPLGEAAALRVEERK